MICGRQPHTGGGGAEDGATVLATGRVEGKGQGAGPNKQGGKQRDAPRAFPGLRK